jgi:hypothetical protein
MNLVITNRIKEGLDKSILDLPAHAASGACPIAASTNQALMCLIRGPAIHGRRNLRINQGFLKRARGLLAEGLVVLTMAGVSAHAAAASYVVSSTADSGQGTLRAALEDMTARPGENHEVAFALPEGNVITLTSPLPNLRGLIVRLYGAAGQASVIDGAGQYPIFRAEPEPPNSMSIELENLELRNARWNGPACLSQTSGFTVSNVSARLRRVRVERCESIGGAGQGGAVSLQGAIEVEDSTFIGNRAVGVSGPGLLQGAAINGGGNVVVRRSRFEDNVLDAESPSLGARGAAIRGVIVTIEDSHFERNRIIPEARPFSGVVNCNRCVVRRSSFSDQPGPSVFAPSLDLENVSFIGARGKAAVVAEGPGPLLPTQILLRNVTFVAAEGPAWSGAAHLEIQAQFLPPVLSISNTLFGPIGGAATGCINAGSVTGTGGWNIASEASCASFGIPNTSIIPAHLGLGPALPAEPPSRAFAVSLREGSPAIDSGSPGAVGAGGESCAVVDGRGETRPLDGDGDGSARCDVGVFEAPTLDVLMRDGFEG